MYLVIFSCGYCGSHTCIAVMIARLINSISTCWNVLLKSWSMFLSIFICQDRVLDLIISVSNWHLGGDTSASLRENICHNSRHMILCNGTNNCLCVDISSRWDMKWSHLTITFSSLLYHLNNSESDKRLQLSHFVEKRVSPWPWLTIKWDWFNNVNKNICSHNLPWHLPVTSAYFCSSKPNIPWHGWVVGPRCLFLHC